MRNVTSQTVLSVETMKACEEIFLQMCSIGVSPRNAVLLTAEKMGFESRMTNTLYASFVAKTIEQNMMDGLGVEKSVRRALATFENDNEEAIQALIALEEMEMKRIHQHVQKDELIGIGVPQLDASDGPSLAADGDGKMIGAIKIFGADRDGKTVAIDASELQAVK